MDGIIPVQPTDVVRSCVAVRLEIQDFQLNATSCTVRVLKLDASGVLIGVEDVGITEEEYAQWSYDDQYIIDLVLTKLGMTPVV